MTHSPARRRLGHLALFLTASLLHAQPSSQFAGELRYRSEFRQNADFDSRLGDAQAFVSQRLRLGVQWQFRQNLEALVQLQDSRLWGEEGSSTRALGNTGVHQAYLDIYRLAGKAIALRIGRQELAFGSERLVGSYDWDNNGRAFDALKLTFGDRAPTLSLWLAHLRDKNATGVNSNQEFAGAYFSWNGSTRTLDLYAMALTDDREFPIGSASGEKLWLYTIGVRYAGDLLPRLTCGLEGAYQGGSHGNLDIAAFALALRGDYTIWKRWSAKIGASYDFGSGDSNPNDSKLETFSSLFPSIHRHWGAMDYASWSNIADLALHLASSPAKDLELGASLHYFQLAHGNDAWYSASGFKIDRRVETLLPALPGESIEVGYELGLEASYRFRERMLLNFGYSRFLVGNFIKAGNPEADPSSWGYLSITMGL